MILFTRRAVEQAAAHIGDPKLADLYFQGNQGAFEKISAVLKDAAFVQPPEQP